MNRILTMLASAILIVAGGFFLLTGTRDLLSGAFPGWIEGFAGVCLLGAGYALLRSEFQITPPTSQRPSRAIAQRPSGSAPHYKMWLTLLALLIILVVGSVVTGGIYAGMILFGIVIYGLLPVSLIVIAVRTIVAILAALRHKK